MPPHGINFVNEDDAGRMRLALLEEVAHPACPHPDEHLDEVGSRHREEGPARLAGDGLGQERLSRSRRAYQQCPLGEPAAEAGELLRILQELDDLLQLHLGLVRAGHVGKGHLGRVAGKELGLGFPEGEGPAATGLELAQKEEPEPEDHDPGKRGDDDGRDPALRLLGQDGDVGVFQPLDKGFAVGHGQKHLEALGAPAFLGHRVPEVALEPLAVEHFNPSHIALVELLAELGVGEFLGRVPLPAHHLEQGERQQAHHEPESQVLAEVSPVGARGSGWDSVCHLFQVRNER